MGVPKQIVRSIIDYFLVRRGIYVVTFANSKLVRGMETLSNHCKYVFPGSRCINIKQSRSMQKVRL